MVREISQMTSSFFGHFDHPLVNFFWTICLLTLSKVTPCQLWLTPLPPFLVDVICECSLMLTTQTLQTFNCISFPPLFLLCLTFDPTIYPDFLGFSLTNVLNLPRYIGKISPNNLTSSVFWLVGRRGETKLKPTVRPHVNIAFYVPQKHTCKP